MIYFIEKHTFLKASPDDDWVEINPDHEMQRTIASYSQGEHLILVDEWFNYFDRDDTYNKMFELGGNWFLRFALNKDNKSANCKIYSDNKNNLLKLKLLLNG